MSIFGRLRRPPPATSTLATRSQIRPPETWGQAAPVWASLRMWLSGKTAPADPLPATRTDFLAALDGLAGRGAQDLRLRGEHAQSMRELWHLRAELYNLIARQLNQAEAERRLAQVNRHFTAQTSAQRPPRTRAPAPSGHHHPSETIF